MILGGSNCQKNALLAAKRLGHSALLVDYYENPPAAALADIHVRASTFDVAACVAAARAHGVQGVFTIGTDQPVYTAAAVAAELGLPTLIGLDTARAVTNKRVMKERLTQSGIPTASYRFVSRNSTPPALAGLCAPLVLKPLDSQGQRGIFKLQSPGEVFAHLEETLSFSRCEEALVEEFYPSTEITVSGWVQAGALYILAVTDRQLFEHPTHIGVCVGHRFPTIHMRRYPEIKQISQRVAVAFDIKDGPIYIQMLVGGQGIKVNELACRIGGAFEDVFLPYVSGFPILDEVLHGALGQRAHCTMLEGYDPSRVQKQVSVQLVFCKPGEIACVTPLEELLALPFVLDAAYNYRVGQCLPVLENAAARFGHCVLVCEAGDMDALLVKFYNTLRVTNAAGENLVIPRNFSGEVPTTGR